MGTQEASCGGTPFLCLAGSSFLRTGWGHHFAEFEKCLHMERCGNVGKKEKESSGGERSSIHGGVGWGGVGWVE